MTSAGTSYTIESNSRKQDGKIVDVEFTVKVTPESGKAHEKVVSMDEDTYKELAATSKKPALPWDKFVKVLLSFMVGKSQDEIGEAFKILDADNSGTIDIKELAAFLPALVPGITEEKLMQQIKKIDRNTDQKMSLAEFSRLIKSGIGMKIVIGE